MHRFQIQNICLFQLFFIPEKAMFAFGSSRVIYLWIKTGEAIFFASFATISLKKQVSIWLFPWLESE
jgi:hypothetical protein